MDQESASRYAEELRQFSASHRVRFGHQHDLLTLFDSLESSSNFRAEFGSMVRSILYREHEGVSLQEILALIEMTWSGSDRFERIPHMEGRLAGLSDLLREVVSRPRGNPQPIVETAAITEVPALETATIAPTGETASPHPLADISTNSSRLETAWALQEAGDTPAVEEHLELSAPALVGEHADALVVESVPMVSVDSTPAQSGNDQPDLLHEDREDPWADGSFLHREVLLFAERHGRAVGGRA